MTGTSTSPSPSFPLARGCVPSAVTPSVTPASVAESRTHPLMTSPAHPCVEREGRDVVADECAAERAAAVDDQHTALARLAGSLPNEDVVLVAPHRRDLTRERPDAPELAEYRLADGCAVAVGIE